jgi:hypothetical protein
MTCTILTASFANDDQTAVIIHTVEVGHQAISARDTPAAWAAYLAWRAAGGMVRPLEQGGAYQAALARDAGRAALRASALRKLATLGITPDELRSVLD